MKSTGDSGSVQLFCLKKIISLRALSLLVIIYQTLSKYNPFEDKYNSRKALRMSFSVIQYLIV